MKYPHRLIILFLLSFAFLVVSCQQKMRDDNFTPALRQMNEYEMIYKDKQLSDYEFSLALKGDTLAYIDFTCSNSDELKGLLCAIYMSEHFGYHHAYGDVFYNIMDLHDKIEVPMGNYATRLYMKYLEKGASKNDKYYLDMLSRIYLDGTLVPVDTLKGRDYLIKAESNNAEKADSIIDNRYRAKWANAEETHQNQKSLSTEKKWASIFLETTCRYLMMIGDRWGKQGDGN